VGDLWCYPRHRLCIGSILCTEKRIHHVPIVPQVFQARDQERLIFDSWEETLDFAIVEKQVVKDADAAVKDGARKVVTIPLVSDFALVVGINKVFRRRLLIAMTAKARHELLQRGKASIAGSLHIPADALFDTVHFPARLNIAKVLVDKGGDGTVVGIAQRQDVKVVVRLGQQTKIGHVIIRLDESRCRRFVDDLSARVPEPRVTAIAQQDGQAAATGFTNVNKGTALGDLLTAPFKTAL